MAPPLPKASVFPFAILPAIGGNPVSNVAGTLIR
jgi:hypothetical protein